MSGARITRLDTGASFTFDGNFEVAFSPETLIPSHPSARGEEVVDGARARPLAFTLPLFQNEAAPRLAGSEPSSGRDNVERAQAFLDDLVGVKLTVYEPRAGTFTPCLLETHPYTVDNRARRVWNARFKRVRIPRQSSVNIPPERVARTGSAPEEDPGKQPTVTATSSEEEVADSWLLQITEYGGVAP